MAEVATQTDPGLLRLQLTGNSLKKILVTSVRDLGGVDRDVMFVAGTRAGMGDTSLVPVALYELDTDTGISHTHTRNTVPYQVSVLGTLSSDIIA